MCTINRPSSFTVSESESESEFFIFVAAQCKALFTLNVCAFLRQTSRTGSMATSDGVNT